MKKKLKFASLMTMLSLVMAFFVQPAYAAYEYTTGNIHVYNPALVSYYWGWDGDWSVPYLELSNGWNCFSTDTTYTFTADSYRGRVGYCYAPGVNFTDQTEYYSKDEAYFESVADTLPHLDKEKLIELTGYVLSESYKGYLSQSYFEDETSGKDVFGHILASQILLWEVIVGERSEDFTYLGPWQGCSACKDAIRPVNPVYDSFISHYDAMEAAVRKALNYPSFAKASVEDAEAFAMEWDGDKYSLTLRDENAVLNSYDIITGNENIRMSRSGDTVTFYSEYPVEDPVLLTVETAVRSDSFMVWGSPGQNDFHDIANNPYSYNQTLLFDTGTVSFTKTAYFNVYTKAGEIEISKTSADCSITDGNMNYSLEGAVYGVYTEENAGFVNEDSLIGEIVTDENGNGSIIAGISAGRTYYVKEISSPKGYLLDESVYAVTPSGTGSGSAVVHSVERPVNDPMVLTLSKGSSVPGDDIPSLEGTEFTVKYYDLDPDTDYTAEELDEKEAKRTWIITVKKMDDGSGLFKTQLGPSYLAEGSDELYLSENGETIMPVGYFSIKETKASPGYTCQGATYYSGGQIIAEGNATIVGRVDFEGNITPEGINITALSVLNDPVDPESPGTGNSTSHLIWLIVSFAAITAYMICERKKEY